MTPVRRLMREPGRFSFDAAVRLLSVRRRMEEPGRAVRFAAASGATYPAAEVQAVQDGAPGPAATVTLFGLTGPSGVLPRHYTEAVVTGLRQRSRSLRDFLDVMAQGVTAQFAAAGSKYRPHRAADKAALAGDGAGGPHAAALLAFTGYGTPHLADRLPSGPSPLRHYAGLFATRPRSADRLASLVSDWLGRPVEVEQFAGAWLALPPDQRTALGRGLQIGAFSRLGEDATIGIRAWDPQARIVLRVGPLDLATFTALLPDRPALRELVGLVRAFVGFEVGFAVNPVLAAPAVPGLVLGGTAAHRPQLGWNSWIPGATAVRRHPAADAVFEAEIVEALA